MRFLLLLIFLVNIYAYPYYPNSYTPCDKDTNCPNKITIEDCIYNCCCQWCQNSNNIAGTCLYANTTCYSGNARHCDSSFSTVLSVTILIGIFLICSCIRMCICCTGGR